MNEKPIIFNSDMVRAILENNKTQTRRVMRPQPTEVLNSGWGHGWDWKGYTAKDQAFPAWIRGRCPYGQPGDRLWVRETWQLLMPHTVSFGPGEDDWDSEAEESDFIPTELPITGTLCYKADDENQCKWWRPSIYMPRWASRITLEITNVRVERVLYISRDDAFREGVEHIDPYKLPGMQNIGVPLPAAFRDYQDANNCFFANPVASFLSLWDSINAGRGFPAQENPYVWVIEFRRVP